jgi:hypothetical protein
VSSTIVSDVVKKPISLALSLALVLSAVAPIASAQEVTGVAQTLFDEGKKLMKEEKYEQACPKLAESYKLQPFNGTLLNLATCNEKWGKTATAYGQFRDALSASKKEGNADREAYARTHIAALEPKISHLTITAQTGADVSGVTLTLDGVSVSTAVLGSALPVDPGKHVLSVSQKGKKTWSTDVEIGKENDSKSVAIPPLEAEPEQPKDDVKNPPPPPKPDVPPPKRDDTVAWAVGGTGIALLGVGVFTGIEASSKWGTRNDNCTGDVCKPAGVEADKSARKWALATDIFVATGLVATGVGAYLLLKPGPSPTAPTTGRAAPPSGSTYVAPSVGPGYAGFAVTGAF